MRYRDYDEEWMRLVEPEHDELVYCGRIDDTDRTAPVFVMPGSFVRMEFSGSSWVKAVVVNRRRYFGSWAGVLLDDRQSKVEIERDGVPVDLLLAEGLDRDRAHSVTFFKRMDQCHDYTFLGFLLEKGARVEKGRKLPRKKIEFYGDSVTAGEVAEAVKYMGQPDPEHNGEYNNAYFSYAWATARRLHAQVHLVAQGGMPLLDGTGYFDGGDGLVGMESCYDKVYFFQEQDRTRQPSSGTDQNGKAQGRSMLCAEEMPEAKPDKTARAAGSGMPEEPEARDERFGASEKPGALQIRPRMERWNFGRFTPHVVVVAIGQNDAAPADIMREDYHGEKARNWRERYKGLIRSLRQHYPDAWIVLSTTILLHYPGWDRSIGKVCAELNDPKIVHFLYQENGRGTPGHVRAPEAMNMALELSAFIEGLSPRLWD